MADNGMLTKTLFINIACQARTPAVMPQSMHQIATTELHMRLPHWSSRRGSMLGMIENMKFFLHTRFGDSKRLASGGVNVKVQGLTQGNGASPSGWAVISIVILRAHGKKGHGAKFRCPITNLLAHILAILYVDDTYLLNINFDHDKSIKDAHAAIQNSVNSWENLLIATGGALKLEKCFYSIISFEWVREIQRQQYQWQIWSHSATPRRELRSHHTLPSFPHRKKTLGAMTSPDGTSSSAIQQLQEKAQQWVDAVRNRHIHHRNVWFLLQVQFWPWVEYSLCNSMASYEEIENALQRQYYQILPLGGVIRTAPLDCRMVDNSFYCPGLPHPSVEAVVAMTNKLLMHFGCRTGLRTFLRTSYSFLLLETKLIPRILLPSHTLMDEDIM
jgi:hypothetical protein